MIKEQHNLKRILTLSSPCCFDLIREKTKISFIYFVLMQQKYGLYEIKNIEYQKKYLKKKNVGKKYSHKLFNKLLNITDIFLQLLT